MPERFYNEEEAQEILRLAAGNSPAGMSRNELVRAALELGIPAESIEAAEAEMDRRKKAERAEKEERSLRTQFERYYRSKLIGEVGSFLSPSIIILGIWYLTGAGYFWPMWVLPWLAIGAFSTFITMFFGGPKKERRYQRWLEKGRGSTSIQAGNVEISFDDDESCLRRRTKRGLDVSVNLAGPTVIISGRDKNKNQKQELS